MFESVEDEGCSESAVPLNPAFRSFGVFVFAQTRIGVPQAAAATARDGKRTMGNEWTKNEGKKQAVRWLDEGWWPSFN